MKRYHKSLSEVLSLSYVTIHLTRPWSDCHRDKVICKIIYRCKRFEFSIMRIINEYREGLNKSYSKGKKIKNYPKVGVTIFKKN